MSSIEADFPPGDSTAVGLEESPLAAPARVWVLALAAGLMAGFAAWLIGEAYHGRFDPPPSRSPSSRSSPKQVNERFMAREAAHASETTVAFAALGAALGLALGLAGGAARGSARSAALAAIVGSILGGLAGGAMARALLPIYFRNILRTGSSDLVLALMIHGGTWSVIGAVGGAAFGIGFGDRSRAVGAILGGLLGAVAGVLVYEVVGALAFQADGITSPLSRTSGTRLFARLAVTILASAGAAWGALDRVKRSISRPVSSEHHA